MAEAVDTNFKLNDDECRIIDDALQEYGRVVSHSGTVNNNYCSRARRATIYRIEAIINNGWRTCLTQDD